MWILWRQYSFCRVMEHWLNDDKGLVSRKRGNPVSTLGAPFCRTSSIQNKISFAGHLTRCEHFHRTWQPQPDTSSAISPFTLCPFPCMLVQQTHALTSPQKLSAARSPRGCAMRLYRDIFLPSRISDSLQHPVVRLIVWTRKLIDGMQSYSHYKLKSHDCFSLFLFPSSRLFVYISALTVKIFS